MPTWWSFHNELVTTLIIEQIDAPRLLFKGWVYLWQYAHEPVGILINAVELGWGIYRHVPRLHNCYWCRVLTLHSRVLENLRSLQSFVQKFLTGLVEPLGTCRRLISFCCWRMDLNDCIWESRAEMAVEVMFVWGKKGHFQFEGRSEKWLPGIRAGGRVLGLGIT